MAMKCWDYLFIAFVLVDICTPYQANYVHYNGMTIRIQRLPQQGTKRKLPSWVDAYKRIESKHEQQKLQTRWIPSTTITRNLKPTPKPQYRPRLVLNRHPIMEFYYNNPQKKMQGNVLPSLNALVSQSYYSQLLQRQRINRIYQDQLQRTQKRLAMQRPQSYINQQLDKKDVIRNAINTQYYRYPYWSVYNQPQARSFIPTGSSFYSGTPSMYMMQNSPVSSSYFQNTNENLNAKRNLNQSIPKQNATVTLPKGEKQNITANLPKSNHISNSTYPQNSTSTFKINGTKKMYINKTTSTSQQPVLNKTRAEKLTRHLINSTKVVNNKFQRRRHIFHATSQNNGVLDKREYLSSPEDNSFEEEEGEFPMEDGNETDEQQGEDPFAVMDEDSEKNLRAEQQQMSVNMEGQEKNIKEVPLLNIETPESNDLSSFAKKQIEKISNENNDESPQTNGEITETASEQHKILEQQDITKEYQTHKTTSSLRRPHDEQGKTNTESLQKNDEEAEALKEDKEATLLMKSDINKLKLHDETNIPPELPSKFSSSKSFNVDDIKLSAGNIASQNNEIGIDSTDLKNVEQTPFSKFKKLEDDVQLMHNEHFMKDVLNPTGENTEQTIENLQDHDIFDSDKIVKTLSHFKEPPDSIALGDSESKQLLDNEEKDPKGGLVLNGESNSEENSLLDPVKAQERASELLEKVEHDKFRKKNTETPSERSQKDVKDQPKQNNNDVISPEDAMNALDGRMDHEEKTHTNFEKDNKMTTSDNKQQVDIQKDAKTISNEKVESKVLNNTNLYSDKGGEDNNDKSKLKSNSKHMEDEKTNDTKKKSEEKNDSVNAIQTPTELAEQVDKTNKAEVAANAVVSGDVINLLKGMGQIKSKNASIDKEMKISNISMETEEKETKEAVKDLNTAIGILEKKLSLINQAKAKGENKDIHLIDNNEENHAASRSKIELDNSLKLLEKVMNVASKVQNQKKKSVETQKVPQSKVRQRNYIERVNQTPSKDFYAHDNHILYQNNNDYEELQDVKRNNIYRPIQKKRNKFQYYQSKWQPQTNGITYRRSYYRQTPYYYKSPYYTLY